MNPIKEITINHNFLNLLQTQIPQNTTGHYLIIDHYWSPLAFINHTLFSLRKQNHQPISTNQLSQPTEFLTDWLRTQGNFGHWLRPRSPSPPNRKWWEPSSNAWTSPITRGTSRPRFPRTSSWLRQKSDWHGIETRWTPAWRNAPGRFWIERLGFERIKTACSSTSATRSKKRRSEQRNGKPASSPAKTIPARLRLNVPNEMSLTFWWCQQITSSTQLLAYTWACFDEQLILCCQLWWFELRNQNPDCVSVAKCMQSNHVSESCQFPLPSYKLGLGLIVWVSIRLCFASRVLFTLPRPQTQTFWERSLRMPQWWMWTLDHLLTRGPLHFNFIFFKCDFHSHWIKQKHVKGKQTPSGQLSDNALLCIILRIVGLMQLFCSANFGVSWQE